MVLALENATSRSWWIYYDALRPNFRSPGIDSKESIPPAYVAWRVGTSNKVLVPVRQARNRFLGSLKGLQIRALRCRKCAARIFKRLWSQGIDSKE
jgi:hypothetical protein